MVAFVQHLSMRNIFGGIGRLARACGIRIELDGIGIGLGLGLGKEQEARLTRARRWARRGVRLKG